MAVMRSRPFKHRVPSLAAASLFAVVGSVSAACSGFTDDDQRQGFEGQALRSNALPSAARPTTVGEVVDGDTVKLEGLGSSRLVGVDTPEVHGERECFGAEASAFTKRQLRPGSRVRVVLGHEPEDRYGRSLVYLWLPNGVLFNELLLKRGFATPLAIEPNTDLADAFERAARRAGARGEGLWSACASD